MGQPGGLTAISRGLSAAIPPECERERKHPGQGCQTIPPFRMPPHEQTRRAGSSVVRVPHGTADRRPTFQGRVSRGGSPKSRRDRLEIARQFTAGYVAPNNESTEGTTEPPPLPVRVPVGTVGNSPPFQRWVPRPQRAESRAGTAESFANRSFRFRLLARGDHNAFRPNRFQSRFPPCVHSAVRYFRALGDPRLWFRTEARRARRRRGHNSDPCPSQASLQDATRALGASPGLSLRSALGYPRRPRWGREGRHPRRPSTTPPRRRRSSLRPRCPRVPGPIVHPSWSSPLGPRPKPWRGQANASF